MIDEITAKAIKYPSSVIRCSGLVAHSQKQPPAKIKMMAKVMRRTIRLGIAGEQLRTNYAQLP